MGSTLEIGPFPGPYYPGINILIKSAVGYSGLLIPFKCCHGLYN